MKFTLPLALGLLPIALWQGRAQDQLDQVEDWLSFAAADGAVRARASGLLDVEAYHFSDVAPGLIDTTRHSLFNPRLTLLLDAQLGPQLYVFVQGRVDRGFDPADDGARFRFDEYALRWTPWEDGRLNLQVGKFATVLGNYGARHLSWDNPFITAPLPYEGVGATSDLDAPAGLREFTLGTAAEKYEYLPIVWGPNYTTGLAVSGRLGKFDYAAELKNAAAGSRPETWELSDAGFGHPTISARAGFRPDQAWNFGVSVSRGAYLRRQATSTLPAGHGRGEYQQEILGQDVSFAWHHWQLWAEVYAARFEVPRIGNADELAYYIEAKYKFTPQLFGALRWGQQMFAEVRETGVPAGRDRWQAEAAVTYRFTAHTQLKLQYSLQQGELGASGLNHLLAAQFTLRF